MNDGGPFFPAPDLGEREFADRAAYPGVMLRDYLAANAVVPLNEDGTVDSHSAVAAMESQPPAWEGKGGARGVTGPVHEALIWWFEAEARIRYMKADAMLRAKDWRASAPRDELDALADKIIIANAVGLERPFLDAVEKLIAAVRGRSGSLR